jgi:enoyl-CoA hydratase/carnithine racemase
VPEYEAIELTHREGVTEIRFHTDGGSLLWTPEAHREAGYAFAEVAGDRDTKVVIVTGTGDAWCRTIDRARFAALGIGVGGGNWEVTWWEGKRLLRNLLEIDVPVIGAVNGPAFIHAEVPLLADIVLAADTTIFADKTHFTTGSVPADGVHLVWPWLIGHRRAKYFLTMRQEIEVEEAVRLGFVNEVLPADALMERAWEIALEWAKWPLPFLRYTREALNTFERQHLLQGLASGLALEGLAYSDAPPPPRADP